ncbi:DEKNAAC104765 [Brettanomyces naardenensis]|uniref:DEKNAAC104765 n=1 Tax=Brettanomyces naardenensis TaxID=13370 RepID=A0A448YRS1_BRENA|nr:DEKNAAC104765 [Brettanomyces naardenensis]
MLVTHGSWWILWPIQFTLVANYKAIKRAHLHRKGLPPQNGKPYRGFIKSVTSSIKTQHRNVAHTAELTAGNCHTDYSREFSSRGFHSYVEFFRSFALSHMFKSSFFLSIILNVAGATWYIAMQLSTGADVTAIYNSSAFSAYLFAVPILHEAFSWIKAGSVIVAVAGVGFVAYGGPQDHQETDNYPHRTLGNIIILTGAVLYGFYEVMYKRLCCPPAGNVSARREATFSNFTMCLIGINTTIILSSALFIAYLFGFYSPSFPASFTAWRLVILSVLSNIVFSVSFLGLMSLTSPVFSSVASLVTILLVGASEWLFRGISIGLLQAAGYCLIMAGFCMLTYASWAEISEEDTEDELIDTDSESTAPSSERELASGSNW